MFKVRVLTLTKLTQINYPQSNHKDYADNESSHSVLTLKSWHIVLRDVLNNCLSLDPTMDFNNDSQSTTF
jgi:hypothetical protein